MYEFFLSLDRYDYAIILTGLIVIIQILRSL